MHDWAEVHRLARAGKTDIAEALHISRNTVAPLLALPTPPVYERPAPGSRLDAHKDAVAQFSTVVDSLCADDERRPRASRTSRGAAQGSWTGL